MKAARATHAGTLAAVFVLASGCGASRAPVTPPTSGAAGRPAESAGPHAPGFSVTFDTTYYVTSRARRSGRTGNEPADSLEFGMFVTRFRERAGFGSDGRLLEGVDKEVVDSSQFSRAEFRARMHIADSIAAVRGEGAVLYVHGYATSFRRSMAQGAEIAHRGAFGGPFIVFSWPAHASLATWPSWSAVVTRAYREDSVSAAANQGMFLETVLELGGAVRPSALTIVGHSMGASLVAEAVARPSATRTRLQSEPLNALVLFAPDISADRFRDSLATALEPVARRRVVYVAGNDRMLGLSRLVNHNERLGDVDAARRVAGEGVEIVDVTRGRRVNGAIRKLFEPRHAMRLAATALHDFYGLVRGRPVECRIAGGQATREGPGLWALTDAPLPVTTPVTPCDASPGAGAPPAPPVAARR